ncbi:hypothetical protein A0H81_04917 [Grifola frondosa]|uniref:Polysaccharide lyase 14 domain-containing protein n=1 Tax=Grifola frondosa TaxID=5627 RepID=A0A1C7MGS0_GRIFR|nr:hypothetical protein A0H81_04917 [Grifola frondosa]
MRGLGLRAAVVRILVIVARRCPGTKGNEQGFVHSPCHQLSIRLRCPHGIQRRCKARSVTESATSNTLIVSPTATASSASTPAVNTTSTSAHASSTQQSSTQASSTNTSSSAASSTPASSTQASSTHASSTSAPDSSSWTTSSAATNALSLSDNTLRPFKLISALSHNYVTAPDGKQSMQAHYPAGSYTFGHSPQGGFSFYAPGPSSVDLTTAKEATLGYSVYFPANFDFVKGGKLPGLYGVLLCSLHVAHRRRGRAVHVPAPTETANQAVCNVAPFSTCNDVYGASVGRGSFSFKAGTRTTISQRVRLNDIGQQNGELELFADGVSMFTVSGLVLRTSDAGRIRGIQMQTFFGGSDSSWASPTDQDTYFSDFSVAITETL